MVENSQNKISDVVYQFINKNFSVARKIGLKTNDNLIEKKVIDSMGLLTLITFLEETFNVQILDEDVGVENFGSIETITSYIMHLLAKNKNKN